MPLNDFFFLRPLWLLLLIPSAWLIAEALRKRRATTDSAWSKLVDPHLLAALTVGGGDGKRSRWMPAALGAGLLAATLAMAGPTWTKIEQPTFQAKPPVVVALSLAQSMNADDIKPSRLTRAGHKLRDILDRQEGGDIGLVIYSDRPFVASPLTADAEVIRQMLPELSSGLMPVLGNRADLAIAKATELLDHAGAGTGRIVLLADGAGSHPADAIAAANAARKAGYQVEVIEIGTDDGAALQTAEGHAITGPNGAALHADFDADGLRRIAEAGGGSSVALTADGTDVARILPDTLGDRAGAQALSDDFRADRWADMGYWLLLIPVLLAPLAFRRGLLFALPLALGLMGGIAGGRAEAADLSGLWKTPDQKAATAFGAEDYASAAQGFEDTDWRAAALYRAGDYAAAAGALAGNDTPEAAYNRGNALARSGDLKGALDAYDHALKLQPDNADAQFNRDLVEKLLKEQQKQQQQQQQDKQQQQQGGDSQDQQQAQDQQGGGEGQDQNQQSDGGGQDQQQSQDQQGGGEGQDQQQAQSQQGGDGSQDQKPAQNQPQDGQGQGGQAQPQPSKDQDQTQTQARQTAAGAQQQDGQPQDGQAEANSGADSADTQNTAFQEAMDAALDDKGDAGEPADDSGQTSAPAQAASSGSGMTEQQQANEQMLRSVPDDASGLLRARIRQYYARRQ
ncbi:VWA domain-containing protein [Tropicimonas sp. IMCC34043]|uniref:VWA domain-containing protein n=1 Tax=Tropicimonas sp. IMCC34043 TaxID=2248760 RepID=UPI000E278DAC|nr:VWA domain-containing protein [Tropicimonas sp. IMCC34043]